jgi:hypothetical protein
MAVCDSCLDALYDEGYEGEGAEELLIALGADLPDHICESVETCKPCDCACQRG